MGLKFSTQYISTIGVESHKKLITREGSNYLVKVWDTAGQERFGAIASRYYKGADCILLIYDLTARGNLFLQGNVSLLWANLFGFA